MKTFFRTAALLFLSARLAIAADLSATGTWIETVTAANLAAGAGSDLTTALQSASGVTVMNVTNAPGAWRIKARVNPAQWNGNFTVWVKRTSGGSGSGTVSGGDSYVALGNTDTEIFTGTQDRTSISLQLRLTGLNCRIAPDTYNSAIIFTVQ